MPLSHFPGGLKPPRHSSGGFTLTCPEPRRNRFTVFTLSCEGNGFISPVDALRHGRSPKPFRICTCKKCACNSLGICTCKNKGLKVPWNQHLQKMPGGTPLLCLLYLLCFPCFLCFLCLHGPRRTRAQTRSRVRACSTTFSLSAGSWPVGSPKNPAVIPSEELCNRQEVEPLRGARGPGTSALCNLTWPGGGNSIRPRGKTRAHYSLIRSGVLGHYFRVSEHMGCGFPGPSVAPPACSPVRRNRAEESRAFAGLVSAGFRDSGTRGLCWANPRL